MPLFRAYLRSHASGEVGRIDRDSRTVTADPLTAERAYRALLARDDLDGTPMAAVLSSTAPHEKGSGHAIYFSRFDRPGQRIRPDAPLDLARSDDGTAEAAAWRPPARGGARPGSGRKSADGASGLEKRMVSLDAATIETLSGLGSGNLSLGIRRAAERVRAQN